MKQRHQLLSQARIYLTQNPEDANLTTEELRQMVGEMTANHLMNRVQRFTFSAADNYWLELQRLLQEPNNAVPSCSN